MINEMATILMTLAETKAPSKYDVFINFLTLGRRRKIYNYIRKKYLQENQLLLDAGCGTGHFIEIAEASWVAPIGVDISEGMLQQTQKRFHGKKHHPKLIRSSTTSLPIKSNIFDIIISILVFSELNHLKVQKTLNEFNNVLKRGGILILVTETKPTSKIIRLVIKIIRFPAFVIAALFAKTPRHPIHDIITITSDFGSIIDKKSYLGGYLTLFVIKKNS